MTAKTPVSTYQKISLVQKSSVPLSGVANKHLPALETMPTLTEQVYKNSVDWEKVSEKLGKIPDEPSDELIGK